MSRRSLKLLLDENISLRVYEELKRRGYKVQTAIEELRGASDEGLLRVALNRDKIVVTMDKDFGYLAQAYSPPGVLLVRLRVPTIPHRLEAILRALQLGEKLYGYITVVTETRIRRRPIRYI
ncbi:MAG: DUF5615 family PIN-like protein [Desulfurococcales archaeon]|nr:DUF5615 family PIN-like protein [Desulfurococcales archaeon]